MGLIMKKELFLSSSEEKGKEDATSQLNLLQGETKNGINLKRIWYQPFTSSFVKNVSSL